jgi:hypothetical protein
MLPKPLVFLNKGFLEKFTMEITNPLKLIHNWWDEETPNLQAKKGIQYPILQTPISTTDCHDMQIIWGREMHTLQVGVDNHGACSRRNGSDFQLGIDIIIQYFPQRLGGL